MWEIYAYHSSETLYGVFNGVVALIGADAYRGSLKIVALCGFMAAMFAYAFAPQKLEGWQWLASVTLVLSILMVPRVTVGIVDKTGGSAVVVVDNVPLGLAAIGSIPSAVGNTLTELIEMTFQTIPDGAGIPAELTYQNHGLLFGNRLIRETSGVVFQDAQFRSDLLNFINNCTMYDLASSSISPELFANAADVWPLMSNTNPARFSPVSDLVGGTQVVTCTEAYQRLNARIEPQVMQIQKGLATRMNPTLTPAVAATLIAGQIEQAYIKNRIADAAASAAAIIRQNAVINAINDTSMLAGQRINDQASLLLAVGRAQAVAQHNATGLGNAKLAEEALPLMRNVIEAISIAIFPLVILLLVTTYGKATATGLKSYIILIVWIQLWPMLYAILNYVGTLHAAKELAAAANTLGGANALSLTTYSKVYSTALSGEAVVGYMTMSIPFIAWTALKRLENVGTAMLGGLSGVLQPKLNEATARATEGNVSLGNTSMDQMTLSPVRSSPFFTARQNDFSGNTYSSNVLSGRTAVKAFANEGPASRTVETRVSEDQVIAASASVSAARSEAVAAQHETASVLADVVSRGSGTLRSTANSTGTRTSSSETVGERVGELQQIVEQVAKQTGATKQQVASVAFGGSARFGANIPSIPGNPLAAGAGIEMRQQKNYQATIDQQQRAIESALSSQDRAKFKSFQDSVTRDTGVVTQVVGADRSGQEMSARLATAVSRSSRADVTLREAQDYSERVSSAFTKGESITKDVAKEPENAGMFEDLLRSERGSAAERLKQESYLGSQAAVPTPVGRTMNLPKSFSRVFEQHEANKDAREINVDIRDQFARDKRAVGGATQQQHGRPSATHGRSGSRPDHTNQGSGEAFRNEVRHDGGEITRQQQTQGNATRAEIGVKQDASGTMYTDRSLLNQANQQVKADPDVVVEAGRELVKGAPAAMQQRWEKIKAYVRRDKNNDEPQLPKPPPKN